MKYKAFEDFYKEEEIKHFVLHEYNGILVSPPFCTDRCKDYNKFMIIKDSVSYIDLDLPPATSKFNAIANINDSMWCIPYGIWDEFNVVLEIKNFTPVYHKIEFPGKGQFYSISSNGKSAFSFPLGYEDTNFCLYIENNSIKSVKFDKVNHKKLHMGSVYCNGRFWSPPRGDSEGYVDFLSFDGNEFKSYPVPVENKSITRKYTDIIIKDNILYCLPYGETSGLNEVIEFDTNSNNMSLHKLNIPDFAKKFNVGVLLDDTIIGLPYGDEFHHDSNWGLVYNIYTREHKIFDIDLYFGGKYRFRSGINFNNIAVFFPVGTPTCPILAIDKNGNILFKKIITDFLLSRPILYKNKLYSMAYHLADKTNHLIIVDKNFNIEFQKL